MYTSGFTLIYKDEEQDWLYQDPVRFSWWIWLRNHAASKPCIQSVGATRIIVRLQYGEVASTLSFLHRAWNADERAIDNFLKLLVEDGRISLRDEKGIMIVRVLQYEKFSPPSGYFARHTHSDMSDGLQDEKLNRMHTQMRPNMPSEIDSVMVDGIEDETGPEMPVRRKKEKQEKLKKNLSDYSARERGFFEELKKSDMTIEQMFFSLKPDNGREGLLLMLEEFLNYCLGAEDFHPTFQGFKQHFMNWARIQIRENLKYKSKTTQNVQKEKRVTPAGATRRRGSEGSARTAADYEKPFLPLSDATDS